MLVVQVVSKTSLEVIHYTGMDNALQAVSGAISSTKYGSSEIVQAVLDIDLTKERVDLLRYPSNEAHYLRMAAVKRAQKRLGENNYHLISNNCECFINWAITGKSDSDQVDTAVGVAVGVGVAAAVGVGLAALFGAFSGEKKKEDK